MFRKVLIANRGEIACRIARTCRRLGIATVAVHSDADRHARHVAACDEAVALPGDRAADTYLAMDRIIAAARATGAEAIHPGYGFLAQNADFARRCAAAGVAFIGPEPDSHERMGSKDAAKRLMEAAGVPVVPGYHGADQSDATLTREAARIGYPVMLKAVAGGGGRGMRRVDAPAAFAEALAAARREAKAAFGDERMLVERFVAGPRHIEFQVFGDAHGAVVHLGERECSIQRRFQKVLEETPSPFLDAPLRAAMAAAAVRAAAAIGYRNAGTVEFIVGSDRAFYFMEMNTRLQVEHPITELVTGLDLVEWQLRVAAGERLPLTQDRIRSCGHAFEARICAEDAARGFLPSSGRIERFVAPAPGDSVRLDAGFGDGDSVPAHYDSLLAKLVVMGRDRQESLARLRAALAETAVFGVTTNLPLLRALAADPAIAAGAFDTRFLDAELPRLLASAPAPSLGVLAAAAARALADLAVVASRSPWTGDGWRAAGASTVALEFIDAAGTRHQLVAEPAGLRFADGAPAEPAIARIERCGARFHVVAEGEAWDLVLHDPVAVRTSAGGEHHPGSPMPGRVVALHVAVGDEVAAGQPLLVLEGMKMEYTLRAPLAGRVERLHAAVGTMVEAEAPLVDIA